VLAELGGKVGGAGQGTEFLEVGVAIGHRLRDGGERGDQDLSRTLVSWM